MALYLPEDIVEYILSRLPIKSLLRFRCVSKLWRSLISSTHFGHLQFQQASKIGSHKIILWNHINGFRSVDCETLDDLSSYRFLQLPFDQFFRLPCFFILGSSNGLVCVSTDFYQNFYLWNSTTDEYKKLPSLEYGVNAKVQFYGFGNDYSTNDYKAIIVCYDMIHIFSLKRGTWMSFQFDIYSANNLHPGIFLNGAIHWPYIRNGVPVVMSFGLADEGFSYISLPDAARYTSPDESSRSDYGLGILDGSLCWTIQQNSGSQTIWTMKEYGISSSWAELTTIHFGDKDCIKHAWSSLYITQRGEILLRNPNAHDLPCFDTRRKNPAEVYKRYFDATIYVESLISPHATKNNRHNC